LRTIPLKDTLKSLSKDQLTPGHKKKEAEEKEKEENEEGWGGEEAFIL
jgi:hypothetical protein